MIILLDQHCSWGQGAREKARGEVSSDIFCIVKQTKKQQNEVFFQVVLARIVAVRSKTKLPTRKVDSATPHLGGRTRTKVFIVALKHFTPNRFRNVLNV